MKRIVKFLRLCYLFLVFTVLWPIDKFWLWRAQRREWKRGAAQRRVHATMQGGLISAMERRKDRERLGIPQNGEIYQHVNGHRYAVVGVARWDDIQIDFIVHLGEHDGRLWVRPLDNFTGKHKSGRDRFVRVQ